MLNIGATLLLGGSKISETSEINMDTFLILKTEQTKNLIYDIFDKNLLVHRFDIFISL